MFSTRAAFEHQLYSHVGKKSIKLKNKTENVITREKTPSALNVIQSKAPEKRLNGALSEIAAKLYSGVLYNRGFELTLKALADIQTQQNV